MKLFLSGLASALVALSGFASAAIVNGDLEAGGTGYEVIDDLGGTVEFSGGTATLTGGDGAEPFSVSLAQGDDGSFLFASAITVPVDAVELTFDFIDVFGVDDPTESGGSSFGDSIALAVYQDGGTGIDCGEDGVICGDIIDVFSVFGTYSVDISSFAGTDIAFFLDLFDEDDGVNTSFVVDNFAFVLDVDPIPLPGAFGFALAGFAGLVLRRRRA